MRRDPKTHPVHRWFAGLVEASFLRDIGLCDPPVLDYLAALLTEFIHIERINLLTDGSGRRVEDVAEMLCEAEVGQGATTSERRRLYHRHIGDYTLFWMGVYPEVLRQMHRRGSRDGLLSYFEQGKRSYGIASELSDDETHPPAEVLHTLSDQFEYCVYGLALVRKNWEKAPADGLGAGGLMLP